ncbi:unnamed protein product [Haemonchus placei]|uniref:Uncharacterized protein n=1 Tax=Haemonchus placei TaxID=6290 RepID=A0A0N4WD31_HAEPC|nr:unnamed protein product [Haemonchus placei]
MGGAQDKINRAHTSSAEQVPEWAMPSFKHLILASKKSRQQGKMFKDEDWANKPGGGDPCVVGGALSKWAVLFRCIRNSI